jgi:DNA end-binding protein Ku
MAGEVSASSPAIGGTGSAGPPTGAGRLRPRPPRRERRRGRTGLADGFDGDGSSSGVIAGRKLPAPAAKAKKIQPANEVQGQAEASKLAFLSPVLRSFHKEKFMPRAIWKGSISFGLVNIPVGLYSATQAGADIKLRMLRAKDQSPIKYKRVAEADDKEVPWDEIVKGYEYEKGEFVLVTDEDFDKVNVASNQTVDIREFVDLADIDPMFFEQPYFLAPEKGGDKAYALLREALEKSGKVGIAKVVIKTREHLAAVKPMGKALVLELMHFADELADPNELNLPAHEPGKKELTMAEQLIDSMSGKWKPDEWKDEYREALMQLIEEKAAAPGKTARAPKATGRKPTNVVDLVSVLQESLNAHAKTEAKGKKSKIARHHVHRKAA